MIIVTGGAGFIGSNLVHALNARGRDDVMVVDHVDASASRNLDGARIMDSLTPEVFAKMIERRDAVLSCLQAVLHQGACTDTTEMDEAFLAANNTGDTLRIIKYCVERSTPLVYASSAAIYGAAKRFVETPDCDAPCNPYAASKRVVDAQVRALLSEAGGSPASPVVGLRYFNVYGPREAEKGPMASLVWQMDRQLRRDGCVRLFEGSHGFANGAQRRDFVHVDDIVAVNLWFLDHPDRSGLFNVGTGQSRPFNDLAQAVLTYAGRGRIEYIPFPAGLHARYQSFTEADLTRLRTAGYAADFISIDEGVPRYLSWVDAHYAN